MEKTFWSIAPKRKMGTKTEIFFDRTTLLFSGFDPCCRTNAAARFLPFPVYHMRRRGYAQNAEICLHLCANLSVSSRKDTIPSTTFSQIFSDFLFLFRRNRTYLFCKRKRESDLALASQENRRKKEWD